MAFIDATLLNGYAATPTTSVAGVDYAVGVPAGTVLKDPSTISMAGVSVDTVDHIININGSNVTLNGYDFSLNGGWQVSVNSGSNNTIENSNFAVGSNNQTPIYISSAASNTTIQNNNISGAGQSAQMLVAADGAGTTTIQNNYIHDAYGQDIVMSSDVGGEHWLVQNNVIANAGEGFNSGAHGDWIQTYNLPGANTASFVVNSNTFLQTIPISEGRTQGIAAFSSNSGADSGGVQTESFTNNTFIANNGAYVNYAIILDTARLIGTGTIANNYFDTTNIGSANGGGGGYEYVGAYNGSSDGPYNGAVTQSNNVNMVAGTYFDQSGKPPSGGSTSGSSAPAAPTITSFSTDSGIVGDGITNDNTLDLKGTAAANSTVTVYDGATKLGTTTANASGSWDYITSVLQDATHTLTAIATNASGSSSASAALKVTVDTVAPAAPALVSDTVVNTNHVQLSGTAEANSTITVYDGTAVVGTATTNASGAWSTTTSALAAGAQALTATATDAAGNVSAVSQSLDPVVPGSSTSGSSSSGSSSAPSSGASNLVANGGFETGSFSGWTVGGNSGVVPAGPQTSVDGNAESGSFAANIGAMGSDATLSQAVQTTAGEHYTLTFWLANAGGGANDFSVKWNGATVLSLTNAPTQGYTEYTFDVVGTAGTSQLLISGRNDPSYWSLDAVSVTAAAAPVSAAPTIASFATDSGIPGDHITNDNTVTLTGTAVANSTVTVYDGTTKLGTATASASGGWTYTTAALVDGNHSFTAKDTISGTTSAASSALAVTIDTVAPAKPIIGSDHVSSSIVTLTGTAEANSTVTVFDGTTQLGTASVNANGAWTYATVALANGNHAFTATATDAAGNTSSASAATNATVNVSSNLVTNGSFEAGNFSGWTLGGNYGVVAAGPQTLIDGHAESGKYAANIGAMYGDATLSQAIQTAAGQHYTVTFWLANAGGGGPNDFSVKWNGATLLSLTDAPTQGYTEYTYDVVGTGGTSQLLISGRNDPSYWSLDAISVTADASAPAAMALAAQTPAVAAPTIASFSPDSGVVGDHITDHNTLTLTGTAAADSTVTVYDGTTKLGTTTASASGSWDYITSVLSDAQHQLTATATDASGHTSASSAALSVTVDTHAPAAPVLVSDSVVNTNHELLNGTAEANSTITIYDTDGTTVVGSGTTNSSGNWTVTTSALSSGSHTFTATATDAAGNVSATSQPLDPAIPASSPAAPTTSSSSSHTLVSTSGNDVLVGTNHSDTFVFAPNFGNDVIKSFVATGASHDTIQFSQSSVFDNFASVLSHASQVGQDVVISAGTDSLTLKNTKIGALHNYDFHFA